MKQRSQPCKSQQSIQIALQFFRGKTTMHAKGFVYRTLPQERLCCIKLKTWLLGEACSFPKQKMSKAQGKSNSIQKEHLDLSRLKVYLLQ